MKFLVRLIELVDNYNTREAELLAIEIGKEERKGYKLTNREEKYWNELKQIAKNN